MSKITPFLNETLRVIPFWIAERIRAASDSRSLRRFACGVARTTLANFCVDNEDVRQALAMAESADDHIDPTIAIELANNVIRRRYDEAQDTEAKMKELFDSGNASVVEVDRAHDEAAAYRTLISCLWADPLAAAVHVSYDASYSLGRLSDEELRAMLEPVVSQLR